MQKNYQVNCSKCSKKRYVSYVQHWRIKNGLQTGFCRTCGYTSNGQQIKLSVRLKRKLKSLDNGCLVWTGFIMPNGYARISIGRRGEGRAYIHRVAYELKYGKIPQGLYIDHLCRNRACANPDHLEAVTMRENNIRAVKVREQNRRMVIA